jgi:O-antigen/teichoic acid export membrane protein
LQKEQNNSLNRDDPNLRSKKISRGLGSLTIQNIVTSGLAFIFLAVLLRLTSPVDYTAYSSVLVTVGVAVTVSTFALQYAAARYVSLFLEEDEKRAWAVAKSVVALSLTFSAVATAIFEISSPYLSIYFMKNAHWTFSFELGGLWFFGYSMSTVLQGIIQGMKRYLLLAKMIVVSRLAMLVFAIVTVGIYHSTVFAILAWIIYYAILIVWPLWEISPNIFQRYDKSYYRTITKYSAPLAIAAVLGIISSSGDSIILGGYTNSLGTYNAAIQISTTLGLIIVTPLITTLLPETSSSSKDVKQVEYGVRLAIRFLMLALLPASLLMAGLSRQLLFLFSGGGSYLAGVGALEIIAGTYFFWGMQTAIFSVLQAVGRTIQALVVGTVSATVDIGLSFLLIPSMGLIGGATSRALEALVGLIVAMYLIRQYLGNLDSLLFYIKMIFASIIPLGVVYALSSFLSSRTITLIPYSIIGFVVFLLCAKAMRVIDTEDKNFISHLLPKQLHKFLKYI